MRETNKKSADFSPGSPEKGRTTIDLETSFTYRRHHGPNMLHGRRAPASRRLCRRHRDVAVDGVRPPAAPGRRRPLPPPPAAAAATGRRGVDAVVPPSRVRTFFGRRRQYPAGPGLRVCRGHGGEAGAVPAGAGRPRAARVDSGRREPVHGAGVLLPLSYPP